MLFSLPVTKAWLKQFMLGMTLIGHSSFRGVVEVLRDLFDYSTSLGTVANVVHAAVAQARQHNNGQNLANVRIGGHDEIFQNGQPVLVGVDVDSTYCYLLSLEEHRDADTWGVRLLELQDHGLTPEATIADFGSGLRAGQQAAWPEVPCRGDVFHALQDLQALRTYVDNRAYETITQNDQWRRRDADYQRRHGRVDQTRLQKARLAGIAANQAIDLADSIGCIMDWLRKDVLAVAGPDAASRRQLYDFLVAELEARQAQCPHRLGPVCRLLKNHRDDLLAFAVQLDNDLAALAEEFQVPVHLIRELLHVQTLGLQDCRRWQRDRQLHELLRGRYHALSEAVVEVTQRTVRASSVVENLNSRLRGYFHLRRHLGPDYLSLLQFFLNHRRFLRSERPERKDKSPAQLLSGQTHPHWLELLGYTRFRRSY